MNDTQVQINGLTEQFEYSSLEVFDAECRNDYSRIAQAQADLTLLYCQFRALGEEGNAALKELTMHEIAEIQVSAAIYYIWIDLRHGLWVLGNVAANWAHDMRPEDRAVTGRARLATSVLGGVHFNDPYEPLEETMDDDAALYSFCATSQQTESMVVLH